MEKRYLLVVVFTILAFSLTHCAKRGTPEGGARDTIPPVITRTVPENYVTNFNSKEIRIFFNEYIKLKDIQKQLVISPPLDNQPIITPYGTSREIRIVFQDTLKENTTYSINFGQSIVDNNEDNPYDFYKYVFSTGNYIDSLKISGSIKDALALHPDESVTVMLYEINEHYTDSVIYKEKPLYVASTIKDPDFFEIENIKEGNYLLVALKDKNNNYLFEPKSDKIAFVEQFITIPADTTFLLTLFKEIPEYRLDRPKQLSGNHILFGYEGIADSLRIDVLSPLPDGFEYKLVKDIKADTLYYWFKPEWEKDSIQFMAVNNNIVDTITMRMSNIPKDSLQVKPVKTGIVRFDEDVVVTANLPIQSFNREKISIMDNDSVDMAFSTLFDERLNRLYFSFDKTERQTYTVTMLPEAVIDFFETPNDTLSFKVSTKTTGDYGFLALNVSNLNTFPVIVQLTTERSGEVHKEIYAEEPQVFEFENIEPGKYYIRLIYDTNQNGVWDTGNFLKRLQPEKVVYYPNLLDIRANWTLNETFVLD